MSCELVSHSISKHAMVKMLLDGMVKIQGLNCYQLFGEHALSNALNAGVVCLPYSEADSGPKALEYGKCSLSLYGLTIWC